MLVSSTYSCSCLYIISWVNYNHSRNCTHQSDILITLMCCSIFSYRDSGMCCTNLYIQVWISNRVSYLLKCTSCCEHCERTCKWHFSCCCKACCNTDHIRLSNTTIDKTIRMCFLEYTCLCSCCQIGIKYYNVIMFCSEFSQSITVAVSCCDLLYF